MDLRSLEIDCSRYVYISNPQNNELFWFYFLRKTGQFLSTEIIKIGQPVMPHDIIFRLSCHLIRKIGLFLPIPSFCALSPPLFMPDLFTHFSFFLYIPIFSQKNILSFPTGSKKGYTKKRVRFTPRRSSLTFPVFAATPGGAC